MTLHKKILSLFAIFLVLLGISNINTTYGATTYQFSSSSYQEIKDSNGGKFKDVGEGDTLGWNGNIIHDETLDNTLFKNEASFSTNDRYYMVIPNAELSNYRNSTRNIRGTLVHMWKAAYVWVRQETFDISIKQPPDIEATTYTWQDNPPRVIASDGNVFSQTEQDKYKAPDGCEIDATGGLLDRSTNNTIEATLTCPTSQQQIFISNYPYRPGTGTEITGSIVGKVFFEDKELLNSSQSFSSNDVKIRLLDGVGNEVNAGDATRGLQDAFAAGSVPTEAYYKEFLLGTASTGKIELFPGTYMLKLNWYLNNVNCSTGEPLGTIDSAKQGLIFGNCRLVASGTTSFEITKDLTINILNVDSKVKTSVDGDKLVDISKDNGINIVIRSYIDNPLHQALATAINWLKEIINNTINYLTGWIKAVLDKADIEDMGKAWHEVRNITITLLLLGLLIIAFANVLSIDIERYGAQRMIPRFVINIVLAYFSFLIVKVLLEVANVLQTEFKQILSGLSNNAPIVKTFQLKLDPDPSQIIGQLGTIIFLVFLLIGVIIALVYLTLLLLARIIIIKFLVVMGPVALILGIMPFTESQLQRWWSELFKWIFMGPAVMGMLLIAAIITKNVPSEITATTGPGQLNALDGLLGVAVAAVAYFMAASIPMSMGGKIMAAWSKRVSGAMRGGATRIPGVREAGQFFAQRGKAKEQRIAERGAKARAWVGQKGFLGRRAAGYTKLEAQTAAKRMHMAQVADRKKEMEYLSDNELKTYLDSKDVKMQQAAFGVLASRERLEGSPIKDGERNEEFFKQQALISKFGEGFYEDPNIKSDVLKNNLGAALHNETLQPVALKIAKAKKAADLKAGEIEALTVSDGGRELLGSFRAEDIRAIKQRGSRGSRESLEKADVVQHLNHEAQRELGVRPPQEQQGPPGPIGGVQAPPGEGPRD